MLSGLLILSFLSATPVVAPDDVPAAALVYAGVALSQSDAPADAEKTSAAADNAPQTPLISVNTDILDMNWTGAMDLSDPMLRPAGIVLPFLDSYMIDNLEVKLRLLNVRF